MSTKPKDYEKNVSEHLRSGNIRGAIVTALYQNPEERWDSNQMSEELRRFDPDLTNHKVRSYMARLRNSAFSKFLVMMPSQEKGRKKSDVVIKYGLNGNAAQEIDIEKAVALAGEKTKTGARQKNTKANTAKEAKIKASASKTAKTKAATAKPKIKAKPTGSKTIKAKAPKQRAVATKKIAPKKIKAKARTQKSAEVIKADQIEYLPAEQMHADTETQRSLLTQMREGLSHGAHITFSGNVTVNVNLPDIWKK